MLTPGIGPFIAACTFLAEDLSSDERCLQKFVLAGVPLLVQGSLAGGAVLLWRAARDGACMASSAVPAAAVGASIAPLGTLLACILLLLGLKGTSCTCSYCAKVAIPAALGHAAAARQFIRGSVSDDSASVASLV
jgi:hypothetical protein